VGDCQERNLKARGIQRTAAASDWTEEGRDQEGEIEKREGGINGECGTQSKGREKKRELENIRGGVRGVMSRTAY